MNRVGSGFSGLADRCTLYRLIDSSAYAAVFCRFLFARLMIGSGFQRESWTRKGKASQDGGTEANGLEIMDVLVFLRSKLALGKKMTRLKPPTDLSLVEHAERVFKGQIFNDVRRHEHPPLENVGRSPQPISLLSSG